MQSYDADLKWAVAVLKKSENANKEYATLWGEIGLKGLCNPHSPIEPSLIWALNESDLMCNQVADRLIIVADQD